MKKIVVLMLLLTLAACSKKVDESADGAEGGDKNWPGAIAVRLDPDLGQSMELKSGKTVKLLLSNKSAESVAFEWKSDDKCGKLEYDKEKAAQAQYIAKELGEDCVESILIKAKGKTIDGTKTLSFTVKGDPEFIFTIVRPETVPENWITVNDYEKTREQKSVTCKRNTEVIVEGKKETNSEDVSADLTLNNLGGVWNTFSWEDGVCAVDHEIEEAEKGVLTLHYDLPSNVDYCGVYDDLKPRTDDCDITDKMDFTDITHITFIGKSVGGQDKTVNLELMLWDRSVRGNQGAAKAAPKGFLLTSDWQRFAVKVDDIIKDDAASRKFIKSVSLRIARQAGEPTEGYVLIDDMALVAKPESK